MINFTCEETHLHVEECQLKLKVSINGIFIAIFSKVVYRWQVSCWLRLLTLKADLRPYENKSESLPEFMLTFTWSPFDILISSCESTSTCTSALVLLKSKNLLTFFVYPCSMFHILWSTCTMYSADSHAHECYKSMNFVITVL